MKLTETEYQLTQSFRLPSDAQTIAVKLDMSERQVRRILDGECADNHGVFDELINIAKARQKRKAKLAIEIELLAATTNQQRIVLLKKLLAVLNGNDIDIYQHLPATQPIPYFSNFKLNQFTELSIQCPHCKEKLTVECYFDGDYLDAECGCGCKFTASINFEAIIINKETP